MEQMQAAKLTSQLQRESEIYGVNLSLEQAEKIVSHLVLLGEKNKQLNLTRITDPNEALRLHLLDSLLFVTASKKFCLKSSDIFLDIGSGGGFPGIPFAIATGLSGVLIDSVGKKIKAVDEFSAELGLSNRIECKATRAEQLALERRAQFNFVLARAVASLNVLIEYASPLLVSNGCLIASKAHLQEIEFSSAQRAADLCGLSLVSRETFELPDDSGHREIYVFQKTGNEKIKLPRTVGMAKNKPL